MHKTLLALLLLPIAASIISCSAEKSAEPEYYVAHRDFGRVSDSLELSILDSLMNPSRFPHLDQYSPTSAEEERAYSVLLDYLKSKQLDPQHFVIYNMIRGLDSTLSFTLAHANGFVYSYNLDRLNQELAKAGPDEDGFVATIPPFTGNISGYDGEYRVNLKEETLQYFAAQ